MVTRFAPPLTERVVVVIDGRDKDHDLILCRIKSKLLTCVATKALVKLKFSQNNLANVCIPSHVIKGLARSSLNHRSSVVLIKDPLLDKRITVLNVINIRERGTDRYKSSRNRDSAFLVVLG